MNRQEKIELLKLLEEKERRKKTRKLFPTIQTMDL